MSWEQLTTWINGFFDKPVVISVATILSALSCGLVFLSRTSWGRKAIKKLTNLYKLGLEKADETLEKVKEVEKLANEKIESLKREYEEKTTALVSIVNFYEESVFTILEDIPNAKVQTKLKQFKESYEDKKKEINQWVTLTYQEAKAEINERVAAIQQEKDEEIARLTNEIASLKELVQPLLKVAEEVENGEETEETENTNTTQEKI